MSTSDVPGAPGSPVYGPPAPGTVDETDAKPHDAWAAWRTFTRALASDLPAHVASVARTRRAIRRGKWG